MVVLGMMCTALLAIGVTSFSRIRLRKRRPLFPI